ncbi:MAG TPA: iron ABC transporter permease [Methylosinus sp.]|uniref:FecCD family ABC transporter permease n=1 Tax=Methylosinus sp. TaxID=427 RepID=UPI002F91D69D
MTIRELSHSARDPLASPARPRASACILGLTVVLALFALFAICVGRFSISVSTVCGILASDLLPISETWTHTEATVVNVVRLPRVAMAIIAGAGLAICGAAFQGLFRNPLVGPQILGISSAASFGGALAITLSASVVGIIGSAFGFGLVALIVIFVLCRATPRANLSIILAGVVVGSFFTALVGVLEYTSDPLTKLPSIVYWLLGSFATANPQKLMALAIPTVLASATLLAMRWRLNILSLNETDASALGGDVKKCRWLVLMMGALIVAAQVAVSGGIGWVGLIIPHFGRMLVGPDHRLLLPASALLGGLYLLAVDTIARTATTQEIPLGLLTALIGAPIFGYLLWRTHLRGWGDGE